jgi:hypothetical protein
MTANTKKHTRGELAEALVYPVTLTPAQKKEAASRLAAVRKKAQEKKIGWPCSFYS